MANNVIGLFQNEAVADRVAEELSANGFDRNTIKRFQGNNDQLEDELRHEGIPADEASYYVNGLSEGGALVSVRAEESATDTAVEIMNRFVNSESTSGTDAAAEAGVQESSYQGSAAGWDEVTGRDAKGVEASGSDYDGAGSAGGAAVGRAAYDAYARPQSSASTPTASSSSGFPVGREAYAAYTRRTPSSESAAAGTDTATNMGFPVGREAYAAYTRPARGSGASEAALDSGAASTSAENASTAMGFPIGRKAYDAYSRDKAGRSGEG